MNNGIFNKSINLWVSAWKDQTKSKMHFDETRSDNWRTHAARRANCTLSLIAIHDVIETLRKGQTEHLGMHISVFCQFVSVEVEVEAKQLASRSNHMKQLPPTHLGLQKSVIGFELRGRLHVSMSVSACLMREGLSEAVVI